MTLDSKLEATTQLDIVQNGSFKATYTMSPNSDNVAIVYDSDGKYVNTIDFNSAQAVSNVLSEGSYTVVFIAKSLFLNNIQNLSNFSLVGLKENVDYTKTKVQIISGKITTIDNIEIPALDESKLYYTDNAKTSFTVNKTDAVAGSYFVFRAAYAFKELYKKDVSNIKLVFESQNKCNFIKNSIYNGSELSSNYVCDGNTLIVPVTNLANIARFCAIPSTEGIYYVNAFLEFSFNGKTVKQSIGMAKVNVEAMTINLPKITSQKTVKISEISMPYSDVIVYDNNVVVGQTKALANGSWSANIQLYKPYQYSYHDIYAEVNTKDMITIISEKKQLIYDANCIGVSKVTMINTKWPHNQSITVFDFINPSTRRKSYSHYPYYPSFTFKVEFTNNDPSLISNVYVNVWTKGGGVTSIPATFDVKQRIWTASSNFNNCYDLPVNVSVNYDYRSSSDSFDEQEQNQQLQEFQEDLLNASTSTEYEFTEDVIGDAEDYVEISFNSEEFASGALWLSKLETLDYSSFDIDKLEKCGFVVWDKTEGGTQYCKTEINGENILMTFIDTETKFAGKCTMGVRYKEELPTSNNAKLVDVLSILDDFIKDGEYTDLALIPKKYYNDFLSELVSIQSLITLKCKNGSNALSEEDRIKAIDVLNSIDNAYKNFYNEENNITTAYKAQLELNLLSGYLLGKLGKFMIGKLGTLEKVKNYPKLSYWKGILSKSEMGLMTCYTNVLNVNISNWIAEQTGKWLSSKDLKYTILKPYFLNEHSNYMKQLNDLNTWIISRYKCKLPTPTPNPKQVQDAVPIIDPSGYVYEAVPANRLAGVTTTIYYKQDITDTTATLWDASEYEQSNPLTTDENGDYAWDVPFGYWQVKYEKEGYQTTYSKWLPVPPPQFDVNVGLISFVQPNVTYVNGYNDYIENLYLINTCKHQNSQPTTLR